jgi:hypothetical protein
MGRITQGNLCNYTWRGGEYDVLTDSESPFAVATIWMFGEAEVLVRGVVVKWLNSQMAKWAMGAGWRMGGACVEGTHIGPRR